MMATTGKQETKSKISLKAYKLLGVVGVKPRRIEWVARRLNVSVDEAWKMLDKQKKPYDVITHGSDVRVRLKYHGFTAMSGYHKEKMKKTRLT